jgi:predicted MFS family arabinose efflux permease
MTISTGAPSRQAAVPGSLIVALLTMFVAACYGFGISLFAQLIPDMRADLGFDYSLVGTITAAVQIAFLLFALLGAWLSPRLGAAQVVVGSTAVCGLCLLVVPSTHSVPVVAAMLAIMGGMAASVFVPMIDLVGRVVAPQHRGFAMSMVSSGTSYGVVIDSLLVPVFVGTGNWRIVWVIVGLGTLAVVGLACLAFRRAGLFQQQVDVADQRSEAPARAGIRAAMPWVLLIWALSLLNGFSTYPFQNFLSPYLREEIGFSVSYAAWVWGTIGVVGMVAGLAVGWMSSRLGLRLAILFCYLCFLVAGAILAFWPTAPLGVASGVLFSLGFYRPMCRTAPRPRPP